MSAHVLLILLNELGGKEIKCEASRAFYIFFAASFMNSIKQEHFGLKNIKIFPQHYNGCHNVS